MFAKCFARIILQYVQEGSGSWKYDHYFPVAKGEGKIYDEAVCRNVPATPGMLIIYGRIY